MQLNERNRATNRETTRKTSTFPLNDLSMPYNYPVTMRRAPVYIQAAARSAADTGARRKRTNRRKTRKT